MNTSEGFWKEKMMALIRKDRSISLAILMLLVAGFFMVLPNLESHISTANQPTAQTSASTSTAVPPPTTTPIPTDTAVPTVESGYTIKSSAKAKTISVTNQPAVPTATVVQPTGVPTVQTGEASMPLHLSDLNSLSTATSLPSMSFIDIMWRLLLVLALIYLVIRALAYFKRKGFTSFNQFAHGETGGFKKVSSSFFEIIEEVKLASQMSLLAIRAGSRILLLLRNGATMHALSEYNTDVEESNGPLSLPSETFNDHLALAWERDFTPARNAAARKKTIAEMLAQQQEEYDERDEGFAETADADETDFVDADGDQVEADADWDQIDTDADWDGMDADAGWDQMDADADWTQMEADDWTQVEAAPRPAVKTPPLPPVAPAKPAAPKPAAPKLVAPAMPVVPKPEAVRSIEKPPQQERLDPALEREILYYAEHHGVGAASRQYGVPHQRITAMRNRFEREHQLRRSEPAQPVVHKEQPQNNVREFRPAAKKPIAAPDHPRRDAQGGAMAKPRSSLIQATYGKAAASQPKKPDVATKTDPNSDTVATSIAQTLAERFNIKLSKRAQ